MLDDLTNEKTEQKKGSKVNYFTLHFKSRVKEKEVCFSLYIFFLNFMPYDHSSLKYKSHQ